MQRYAGKRCQHSIKERFMKYISFALPIFIFAASFFSACKKNNVKAFGIPAGISGIDSAVINSCTKNIAPVYICFDSVLTDSRCPSGAECFWQGTALIRVSFHETANTHNFVMSLKGFPGLDFTSDTTINGYNIIFSDLKPHPDIHVPNHAKPTAFFSILH